MSTNVIPLKLPQIKKLPENVIIVDSPSKKLQTEDLGKKTEMGICLLYDIPFEGKYKYSIEDAEKLKKRLEPFKEHFPYKLKHTAKNGNQYDFTCVSDESIKLSAKTTKKDGKVCPQVIGQPSKKKFCKFFNIDETSTIDQIKEYITKNIHNMLNIYFQYTFDCPIIYYNQNTNALKFIELTKSAIWSDYVIEFSHIKKNKKWNESSTIYINNNTIGEFQVHNHRDCIKFRWCFEILLKQFGELFIVIEL